MDEEAFRGFYDRTARTLRAYLARVTGDAALADDLLQEAYYRFLRARGNYEGDAHRRNALFRIATNLVHDSRRRARVTPPLIAQSDPEMADRSPSRRMRTERATRPPAGDVAPQAARTGTALARLRAGLVAQRNRPACLGLRTGSVKLLLFRARRRLANTAPRERIESDGKERGMKFECPCEQDLLDAISGQPLAGSGRCLSFASMLPAARSARTSPRSPSPSSKTANGPRRSEGARGGSRVVAGADPGA